MPNESSERNSKSEGTIQKLLCAWDMCGLRCTMHTRKLNDFPTEFSEQPSSSCCNSFQIDWKNLRLGLNIFWNIVTVLCGLLISIGGITLKLRQSPGENRYCKYVYHM